MNIINRTIAAVSTPRGKGGVALIRISGDEALAVASACFKAASGKSLYEIPASSAVYGVIYDRKERIDDGIATVFRAPRSYTGEDVVEISCHGGIYVTERVLKAVLCAGAFAAQPGEFTRRAFSAGKITLSQAEAVAGILDARTDAQLRLAAGAASGHLKKEADRLYERTRRLVASSYAAIDFPEEDLAELTEEEMQSEIRSILGSLERLKERYRTVRAVSQGIDTVICGRPNTGKSSLYNAIAGEDLAIVTDIAGTTRDTLSAELTLGNVLLKLNDTAGIRAPGDRVEKIGVERTLRAIDKAELVLAVFDGNEPFSDGDRELCEKIKATGKAAIGLINKCDLERSLSKNLLSAYFESVIEISALTGEGIKELEGEVERLFHIGGIDLSNDAALLNARQFASVERAAQSFKEALDAINAGVPIDAVGCELEAALSALGELDGREVCEEVVNEIFTHFCVGK